jgi:uncharacterized membrane protein (UPF0127 family)
MSEERGVARALTVRKLQRDDGTVVAEQVTQAGSWWARFRGLMLRRHLPAGQGLELTPCNQIHMFFMLMPLDVLFVDAQGIVLRVYHRLRPWRVTRPVFGARTTIELPVGTLKAAGIEKGDRLYFS